MENRHMIQPWAMGQERADSKCSRRPCGHWLSGFSPVLSTWPRADKPGEKSRALGSWEAWNLDPELYSINGSNYRLLEDC